MKIELEDFHEDIIGKAMRGLGIGKSEMAKRTGSERSEIEAILSGGVNESLICSMADELNLDRDKVLRSARKEWCPALIEIKGLKQFNLPFGGMLVNAYLIWDEVTRKAWMFDTGPDAGLINDFIEMKNLEIDSETPCHLWVIGKGDPTIYTKTIDSLGVSDRVTFYGSVENTSPWYQMADLFVLPTIYDPFSNSSLEAIACGCPVLTTSSNGASECVNPQNGLVVSSPELVCSKLSVDWIKSIDARNRSIISSSVNHLSLEEEIGAYLNIFDSHE
tara:strand:+ start:675 stop:1502 length:828 start_codon:yes stop_codon:yes gene_type:complete